MSDRGNLKDRIAMADEKLLALAAEIVSAHVSHNSVSPHDLPGMIEAVYGSLAKLGEAQPLMEEKREPAVSIRSSVKPDMITCLECGAKLKMLKRHLSTDHGLTPDQYRVRWNLPASYPIVASDYANKRKELALKIGLGRKRVAVGAANPEPAAPAPAPVRVKAPRRKKPSPVIDGGETA